MSIDQFLDVLLDALKDSAIVFLIVFAVHLFISLFELKLAKILKKDSKLSPLFGSLFGIVPQCSVSVIASDLYIKEHITMGTVVAIFLSCSDEAIPLMIASHNEKSWMAFLLIAVKFVIGFVIGFVVDLLFKDKHEVEEHLEHCHHEDEVHTGCCGHHIDDAKETKAHKYFIHPLLHSLKIFGYVLVINFAFGILFELVGETNVASFLESNKYLTPLFATIIGFIPNCASSIIITEMFLMGSISFGACLAGLLMNAGLGVFYLFKSKEHRTKTFKIILILFVTSLVFGYLFSFTLGF